MRGRAQTPLPLGQGLGSPPTPVDKIRAWNDSRGRAQTPPSVLAPVGTDFDSEHANNGIVHGNHIFGAAGEKNRGRFLKPPPVHYGFGPKCSKSVQKSTLRLFGTREVGFGY